MRKAIFAIGGLMVFSEVCEMLGSAKTFLAIRELYPDEQKVS